MITVTITDAQDSHTFTLIQPPLVIAPIIREKDVETLNGDIATYYGSTKRQITLDLGFLSSADYAILSGFQARQYQNLKYPTITISGAPDVNINGMTAKITVSAQRIADNCGTVQKVRAIFRESKQMA